MGGVQAGRIPVDDNYKQVAAPGIADNKGTTLNVGVGGVTLVLQFLPVARMVRVKVKLDSGSCTKFTVKIEDKVSATSVINKVYEEIDEPSYVDTIFQYPLAFNNQDTPKTDKLYLTITPDAGADNNFSYRIEGEARVLLLEV